MKDLTQVRSFTRNYSNLQGLKMIPLGLLLAFIAWWANSQHGRPQSWLLPGIAIGLAAILYWLAARYYDHSVGKVFLTRRQKITEGVLGVVGGLVALLAFWVDVSLHLSISAIGLIFTGVFILTYGRIIYKMKNPDHGWNLYLVAAGIMLILSLSPLIGLAWWKAIGFRALIHGISAAAGVLSTLIGFWGHMLFMKWAAIKNEAGNEQHI
jgi:hypothetical protein